MGQEKLGGQAAIDDLANQVTSEEDRAQLTAWQTEFDEARANAEAGLQEPPQLVETPDGIIITEEERRAAIERGDNPSGPYDGGGRA